MLINKKVKSEMRSYIDEKSGREVIKLTETGTNWHFYFTDNSFTLGGKEVLYWHSDQSLLEDIPDIANLYSVNLETGERVQITEFEKYFKKVGSATKTPDSEYLVYIGDGDLYSLNLKTGQNKMICKCPAGYNLVQPSISYDKKYVALSATISLPDSAEELKKNKMDKNYFGFKERMYAIKNSYLIIAKMDGSGAEVVFQDTHWVGHVQFAPDTNEYITFCHEGPWNYVQQRIWMFNTVTRTVKPCYEQKEEDSVGHEFWTRDGLVFFDNRGPGHDGTITSDKTQAVAIDVEDEDAIPQIGFADKECNVVRMMELPYYCNHYHANTPNTLLVADAVEDIVLIDISDDKPSIEVLCKHNTSWGWQLVHCHPTWSWEDEKILFASDGEKKGSPQLYFVKVR